MSEVICFFVEGTPKPAGSKRGFINKKTGRIIITDQTLAKGKKWREIVADKARTEMEVGMRTQLKGPLACAMTFYVARPKAHFYTGKRARELRPDAPKLPTIMPDLTKLLRSAEDALKGIVWVDDSQVVAQQNRKLYCNAEYPSPGVLIKVQEWD